MTYQTKQISAAELAVMAFCKACNTTLEEMKGPDESRKAAAIRNAIAFFIRYEYGLTWKEVGCLVGRSITTVKMGAKNHEGMLNRDMHFAMSYAGKKDFVYETIKQS